MIYAIDVGYKADKAKSVCVAFHNWEDATSAKDYITEISPVAEYVPGQFYKRELPCIEAVLKGIVLSPSDLIVVDGYVFLNDDDKPGLGHYLYEYLDQTIPVIGVAKTSFHNNKRNVTEVFRGGSKKPLYITSIGVDRKNAAESIKKMHGPFRMPTLLTYLDGLTKR